MNKYNPLHYYKEFKKEYLEFILFVKCKDYYYTYESDAKIIYYLIKKDCSEMYKIEKYNFQKMLKVLHDNNLNVVLVGSKNAKEYYTEKESHYSKLKLASKKYFRN